MTTNRSNDEMLGNPFASTFEDLKTSILDGVAALLKNRTPELLDFAALGIDPLHAYKAKEVAKMLGTKRVADVYGISEDELPRVRRGGTAFGYLGINILCYMHRLPPVDIAASIERHRRQLLDERPVAVQPMHPRNGQKTRIH